MSWTFHSTTRSPVTKPWPLEVMVVGEAREMLVIVRTVPLTHDAAVTERVVLSSGPRAWAASDPTFTPAAYGTSATLE